MSPNHVQLEDVTQTELLDSEKQKHPQLRTSLLRWGQQHVRTLRRSLRNRFAFRGNCSFGEGTYCSSSGNKLAVMIGNLQYEFENK